MNNNDMGSVWKRAEGEMKMLCQVPESEQMLYRKLNLVNSMPLAAWKFCIKEGLKKKVCKDTCNFFWPLNEISQLSEKKCRLHVLREDFGPCSN